MALPKPGVIFFIGPIGAGKGTQANALVEAIDGYTHFDTGRAIERVINDPKNQDDPAVRVEKERFVTGLLTTYEFKMRIITEGIQSIAREGRGVVLSGSPRTRVEAENLVPFLENIYGPDSTLVIHIAISEETAVFRNSRRRVCARCGRALVWTEENKNDAFCPRCGGELKTRVLDNEETIRKRYHVYETQTAEVIPYLESRGMPVYRVSGEAGPEEITLRVMDIFALELKKHNGR